MLVSVIWTSDRTISGGAHCMLHCYNSLPVLVWHFQQSHILRQKVLLDFVGKHLCVEETGSEKCESHWSGVENWLQQQDRCWAAVCPRFGLVPSVILGATTPAFSYIPIFDLFSYLIVHVQHQSMTSLRKCIIVWLKSLPRGPAWFTSNTCPLWNFQAQMSQWKWLDICTKANIG